MKGIVYKKRANVFLLKIVVVSFIFLIVSFAFIYFSGALCRNRDISSSMQVDSRVTVVIDPGHGGVDGGAQVNNVFEKKLNLSVSQKIAEFLSLYDVDCVLTRYDDIWLADENSTHKKQSDLLNRTAIANTFEYPVFVSIHMNKFPIEKYSGLQVFYSKNNSASKVIADMIQQNTVSLLQGENNRKTKEAGTSIYVLDRLECPAVLIECGFMSNNDELSRLTDDAYQYDLAYVISTSIINYLKEI